MMLQLIDNEGWTRKQVADAMGVTRNAVLGQYHRIWTETRRGWPDETGDGTQPPGWWSRGPEGLPGQGASR